MTMTLRHVTLALIVGDAKIKIYFLKGYYQGRICKNLFKKGLKTKKKSDQRSWFGSFHLQTDSTHLHLHQGHPNATLCPSCRGSSHNSSHKALFAEW
jgi:hypothetical protein